MKVFRWIAVGLTIIIIAISLIIPFIMGRVMRSTFTSAFQSQKYPSYMKVKLESYDAGWLYSYAKVKVTFFPLNSQFPISKKRFNLHPISYVANLHLINSPFVELHFTKERSQFFAGGGAAVGQLNLISKAKGTLLDRIQGFNTPWDVYLGVAARSRISFYISHGPLSYTDPKSDAKVEMGAMHWWAYADGPDQWRGNISIDGINASFLKNAFSVSNFTGTFDIKEYAPLVWLGDNSIKIPSIQLTMAAKPVFSIKNFHVDSDSNLDDEKISSSQTMGFDELQLAGLKQGPCKLNYTMKNLPLKKLTAMITLINKQQGNGGALVGKQILPGLLKLVGGLRLEAQANCSGDFGAYTMNGWFQAPDSSDNSPQFIKQLEAQFNLNVSLASLPSVENLQTKIKENADNPYIQKIYQGLMMYPFLMATASQQGFFVADGKNFKSVLKLGNGELYINGKKILPRPRPRPRPRQVPMNHANDQNNLQLSSMPNQAPHHADKSDENTEQNVVAMHPNTDQTGADDQSAVTTSDESGQQ